ncbi:MAG TPA: DNA internalization-related competence protein ComEC/Rec2 [Gemmatimonadales bacterium]|nr:DNA internalization-related competence protein ComEC/Rec2 [Gemmatimonadales bacterium]
MRPPLSANIAFAYGAGLATGLARFPAPVAAVLLALPVLASPHRHRRMLCVAAIGLGVLAGQVARQREAASCPAVLPAGPVSLLVRTEEPVEEGGARGQATAPGLTCSGRLSVRWPRTLRAPGGTELQVRGRWSPRPGRFARPGGTLVVSQVGDTFDRRGVADRIRNAVHDVARSLYGRRAPLVDALVLGRRADLDRTLMEEFAGAGLMHLLAISGFHLGLLAGWVFVLLRLLTVRRSGAAGGAALFAVAYTVFLGWPAPAARAAVLAVLLAAQRIRQRMPESGALLGTTALVVLLTDPWAVLELGGWLSIGALWGAVTFARWAGRRLGNGAIVKTLASSVGATLATAPITAAALGTVALAGVGLNLVAIPLAAVVVPAVVASLLLGMLALPLAGPFAAGAGVGLGLLQELARWGASLPGGHLVMEPSLKATLPWLGLLAAMLWCVHRTTRAEAARRLAWVFTGGLWAWTLATTLPALRVRTDEGSNLTLHFLDVGQGDAAAIRTPGGHWVLVDGGPVGPTSDAGQRVVVPFLRRHGVRWLDAIVLSHAHADHLGGLPAVLDRIGAGEVIEPAVASADPLYAGFLSQLDELAEPWVRARRGDGFMLDSVRFRVLHPDTAWAEWGQDLNENSVVLVVEYRRFRAVLTGDAGLEAEARLAGRIGPVSLLKVGHHGSRGATGERWLRELRPAVAVISVGAGNRYGHPAPEALDRLARAQVDVYRTDRDGTTDVSTDGTTMTIHSRRGVATRTVSEP